jgi:protein STU2
MFTDTPLHRRLSPRKQSRKYSYIKRLLFSKMADVPEEDFSQLPLPDRFAHKNWKVRKEGYEAAAKEFETTPDESDPAFRPFIQDPNLWKAAAGDSNVAAQQEGLAALCAFLKFGGQQAATRSRNFTIVPLYEKGLSSTRPAAKASALEALLLYIELDKSDPVIEELLPALSHKQPKIIAAALSAFTAMYHNFGVKVVDYKQVLKVLPKVFGHADKNVRAEATNLTVELYRWLKEAMKVVFWSELKPVQQQDLEKLFEKVKEEPAPKQERFTRAQQAAMAVHADHPGQEAGENEAADVEEEEDAVVVDAFDLAEPIDVYSKIPGEFLENIASTKWKERKEALEALFTAVNTPRIRDGPFDDIIRALAKCMKDANVAVVTEAAHCVEKLALGLRSGFAKYRSIMMTPMMERFKEKKQSVADALGAGLDAIFASTSLSDCLEETLGFLTNKNPQVKFETIKFLIRCLRNTRDVPAKSEQKSIADAATKLLTESTEQMRSGGAEILGTLMKILGERAMGPYLDGLDDIRKTKIKEYFDAAEVKAKEKPKAVAPPAKAAGTSAIGKKVVGGAKKAPPKKLVAPPVEESLPAPKPIAKALPKPAKPAAPPSVYKFGGLKKPSTTPGVSSPQRRVISPLSAGSEEEAALPSPAKFGVGRGGLAGRPLSKPTFAAAQSPPRAVSQGMSAVERAELEELRAEKDRFAALADTLRTANAKLTAEISELQNQNAQLIEDHTRDVLQIKAKETQLVRARGECDVLRSEVESVRKEGERYKREVARLGRESIGRERESMMQQRDDASLDSGIFSDNSYGTTNGNNRPGSNNSARPGSTMLSRTGSGASATARPNTSSRPQSYMTSPSEEKENSDGGLFNARRKMSPPVANPNFAGGRTSPSRPGIGSRHQMGPGEASTLVNGREERSSTSTTSEPAENWKRAAEVTSQLKARIEQMKVCRLLLCPDPARN